MDNFLDWSNSEDGHVLVCALLQVILEVCHIKMGLRPLTAKEEMSVVRYVHV